MNDDMVPEEGVQEYNQLLMTLRSSAQTRVPIVPEEQATIVAQVRKRLRQAMSASSRPDVGAFTLQHDLGLHIPTKQARKSTRLVANLLAAVVVIGLILGSWALFRVHPISSGTPASSSISEPGPVARVQVGGLEASMHVLIGGPYFLSELLPIDVSLTNHTHQPVVLDGVNHTADLCFSSALMVQVTAGGNPSYTFPRLDVACTQPAFFTEVKPGQTITIHQYIPLTRSRAVTLTMGPSTSYRADPLNGRWPTVHIQVNPQVPQNRVLSLQSRQRQVVIGIPAGAKAHLLYMQTMSCERYFDSSGSRWTPLATTVLHEPACPTTHPHWEYIVSAPGYPIVSGRQAA